MVSVCVASLHLIRHSRENGNPVFAFQPPSRILDARVRGHDELVRKVDFTFRHSPESNCSPGQPLPGRRARASDTAGGINQLPIARARRAGGGFRCRLKAATYCPRPEGLAPEVVNRPPASDAREIFPFSLSPILRSPNKPPASPLPISRREKPAGCWRPPGKAPPLQPPAPCFPAAD